jgi:hypothetical protein
MGRRPVLVWRPNAAIIRARRCEPKPHSCGKLTAVSTHFQPSARTVAAASASLSVARRSSSAGSARWPSSSCENKSRMTVPPAVSYTAIPTNSTRLSVAGIWLSSRTSRMRPGSLFHVRPRQIVADGECHQLLQRHFLAAVEGDQYRGHAREFQAFFDMALRDAEAGRDLGRAQALGHMQDVERLERVRWMEVFAREVLGKAQFLGNAIPVCTSGRNAAARKTGETAPGERSDPLTARGAGPLSPSCSQRRPGGAASAANKWRGAQGGFSRGRATLGCQESAQPRGRKRRRGVAAHPQERAARNRVRPPRLSVRRALSTRMLGTPAKNPGDESRRAGE